MLTPVKTRTEKFDHSKLRQIQNTSQVTYEDAGVAGVITATKVPILDSSRLETISPNT